MYDTRSFFEEPAMLNSSGHQVDNSLMFSGFLKGFFERPPTINPSHIVSFSNRSFSNRILLKSKLLKSYRRRALNPSSR
jgi:hypothetical protein